MNCGDAVRAYKAVVRLVGGHMSMPPLYLIPHGTPTDARTSPVQLTFRAWFQALRTSSCLTVLLPVASYNPADVPDRSCGQKVWNTVFEGEFVPLIASVLQLLKATCEIGQHKSLDRS